MMVRAQDSLDLLLLLLDEGISEIFKSDHAGGGECIPLGWIEHAGGHGDGSSSSHRDRVIDERRWCRRRGRLLLLLLLLMWGLW